METIHIVGAGPAGLMAAQEYALQGYPVVVYDHKAAAARKFLVAGNGGFNLSHAEPLDAFLDRYDSERIKEIVQTFNNKDTVTWLESIGVPTFIGSSGKVFPVKGIKPIEVLQRWLLRLSQLGVEFKFGYYLSDFDSRKLTFLTANEQIEVVYDHAVLALGGRSWPKTGSDGKWIDLFQNKGIVVTATGPSNSGLELTTVYSSLAGQPLKNIRLFNRYEEKYGELVFTDYGIEGNAVYHLNRAVRSQAFPQELYIDLKPSFDESRIISAFNGEKISEVLKRQLRLEPTKISLLRTLDKDVYTSPSELGYIIKNFPLKVTGFRPVEEVISTHGGVSWDELNPNLSLKKYPAIQLCGEMLAWDAPTGGYLLQACFATGYYTARGETH